MQGKVAVPYAIGKEPKLWPAATVTDVEVSLTQVLSLELPATTTPAAGALYGVPPLVNWKSTVSVWVLDKVFDVCASDKAAVTAAVVVVGAKFAFDAEIVEVPVAVVPACTAKFTPNAPAGIVTVAGTAATLVLLLVRFTTTPPAGAAFGAICT
jgi:hypothetical protein